MGAAEMMFPCTASKSNVQFFKYAQKGDSLLFSFWNKLDRMFSGINKQKGRIPVIESHSIKV